jgi:4-carboxymuconolactone decarboxylase
MSDSQAMTPAQKAIGDFAPKLVSLTDDVLFGDVWERTELSKRDRSLITVAALITNGSTEQLKPHLVRAKGNGLSEAELKEVIIHLAFYAGWPRAMSARHRCEGDLRRLTAADPATLALQIIRPNRRRYAPHSVSPCGERFGVALLECLSG